MQVKLSFVTFNLNRALHAVSVGKPPESQIFWWFGFFKTKPELTFGFPYNPTEEVIKCNKICNSQQVCQAQQTSPHITLHGAATWQI